MLLEFNRFRRLNKVHTVLVFQGFYTVYTEAFFLIAKEDIKFMTDKDADIPEFGASDSSYEEVVHPFYGYWQSYSTSRSFVWKETYDTRDAPNRRIARLMEKDNKKLRDAAKKEWNEEVRVSPLKEL